MSCLCVWNGMKYSFRKSWTICVFNFMSSLEQEIMKSLHGSCVLCVLYVLCVLDVVLCIL